MLWCAEPWSDGPCPRAAGTGTWHEHAPHEPARGLLSPVELAQDDEHDRHDPDEDHDGHNQLGRHGLRRMQRACRGREVRCLREAGRAAQRENRKRHDRHPRWHAEHLRQGDCRHASNDHRAPGNRLAHYVSSFSRRASVVSASFGDSPSPWTRSPFGPVAHATIPSRGLPDRPHAARRPRHGSSSRTASPRLPIASTRKSLRGHWRAL